ncbi:MAG: hypothetical protein PHE89_06815 [Alphaproteobacteria bacterium]|nr:hypothetical protein [Alphaproteobacteria bacterium]
MSNLSKSYLFIFPLALLGTVTNSNAQTCTIPPTCDELGYSKSTSDCSGSMVKCPFDKSKVYCPDIGETSGNTYKLTTSCMNATVETSENIVKLCKIAAINIPGVPAGTAGGYIQEGSLAQTGAWVESGSYLYSGYVSGRAKIIGNSRVANIYMSGNAVANNVSMSSLIQSSLQLLDNSLLFNSQINSNGTDITLNNNDRLSFTGYNLTIEGSATIEDKNKNTTSNNRSMYVNSGKIQGASKMTIENENKANQAIWMNGGAIISENAQISLGENNSAARAISIDSSQIEGNAQIIVGDNNTTYQAIYIVTSAKIKGNAQITNESGTNTITVSQSTISEDVKVNATKGNVSIINSQLSGDVEICSGTYNNVTYTTGRYGCD